ncbi:MAG TPA: amidase [Myxococcota bacterium]|nr:amidase [Myxococcota bacterium]
MREYEKYDALGLAELVRKGEVSPVELLDAALARVSARNPALNALCMSFEARARREIAAGLPAGPFRGVPFLLKDLHAHVAGERLTFGSRLFASFVSETDSELVARYRRAGLVTFGRTASPEFGLTATTESTLFGATRNPWNLERTSGGSSGGASAAVAAGILPAAHASDGGGSIRIPAACCGLFGLKPTRARVPMGPHSGEGWGGMSTAHAVTRSVRDSAALLDATQGPDLGAPYHAPAPERPYLEEVTRAPGKLRIALQTQTFNGAETDPECAAAARAAAKLCEGLGHRVEEATLAVDRAALAVATQVLMGANVQATADDAAAAQGRALGPDVLETVTLAIIAAVRPAAAADYARAVKVIHGVSRVVEAFFTRFDVLLTPTMAMQTARIGELALSNPADATYGQRISRCVGYTQLFNAAGNPAMSVPLGTASDGMPLGVQFAGRFGDEATLFRLAAQLEAAQPWAERRPAVAAVG